MYVLLHGFYLGFFAWFTQIFRMHGFSANFYRFFADVTQILGPSLKFRIIKNDMEIETTLLYTVHSRLLWTSFLLYVVSNDATKSSNEKRTMKVTFILVFINIVISALTSDVISAGKLCSYIITILVSNYVLQYLLSMLVYSFQETNPNYH